MPYIKQEKRNELDTAIADLLTALRGLESDDPRNSMAGNLNYVFTKVLVGAYSAPRYNDINEVVGILECCKMEYYRRVAAPYESQKAHDEGDVYPQ